LHELGHQSGVVMARQSHVLRLVKGPILRPTKATTAEANLPMQYLPLFLLFMAVLIAAWFYLQRAKVRDAGKTATSSSTQSSTPSSTDAQSASPAPSAPTDRPE
jgi:hypothetical protein